MPDQLRDVNSAQGLTELARLTRRLEQLSRAAVRVQEATTPDAVLAEVGAQLSSAGFDWHYGFLTPTGAELVIQSTSLALPRIAAVERLLGIEAIGFRVPVARVGALQRAVVERQATFTSGEAALREVFPHVPGPIVRQLVRLLGAEGMIVAPC